MNVNWHSKFLWFMMASWTQIGTERDTRASGALEVLRSWRPALWTFKLRFKFPYIHHYSAWMMAWRKKKMAWQLQNIIWSSQPWCVCKLDRVNAMLLIGIYFEMNLCLGSVVNDAFACYHELHDGSVTAYAMCVHVRVGEWVANFWFGEFDMTNIFEYSCLSWMNSIKNPVTFGQNRPVIYCWF